MENIILRQYEESDISAIWQLHVDGINQTGTFKYNSKLDNDFKDIKGIYLNRGGEFYVALFQNKIIGMGALRKVDNKLNLTHDGQE